VRGHWLGTTTHRASLASITTRNELEERGPVEEHVQSLDYVCPRRQSTLDVARLPRPSLSLRRGVGAVRSVGRIHALHFYAAPHRRVSVAPAERARARKRTLVQGQLCRRARAGFDAPAGGVGPDVWPCPQVSFHSWGLSFFIYFVSLSLTTSGVEIVPSFFLFYGFGLAQFMT
jgi:hypothetical protein